MTNNNGNLHDSPMNGADKIDLVLNKMEVLHENVTGLIEDVTGLKEDVTGLKEDVTGLKEDVTSLKEDVIQIRSGLKNSDAKVDALMAKFDGFDYKLEGQDKKLEGQDAKIENSRYKIQYWLVAFMVGAILFGLAILDALPGGSGSIFKLLNLQTNVNFLFFVGSANHRCNLNTFTSILLSVNRLRKLTSRLRILKFIRAK